jgi:outer membrane protein W
MKKIFSFFMVTCFAVGVLSAQEYKKQYYTLGWQLTQPVGDFSDFANQFSLRGGYFDAKILLKDNFSVGFGISYAGFNEEKDRTTYRINEGTAVTAAVYNYVVEVPFTVGGYYHFSTPDANIQPYAGLGLGLNYITEHTIVQDWELYDDQWSFVMKPEIGMYVPFGPESPFGLNLKVSYEFNTNKYTTVEKEYKYLQGVNIGIGVSYLIR